MSWVLIAVAAWLLLGVTAALLIGMAIHQADVKAVADDEQAPEPNVVVDLAQRASPQDGGDGEPADQRPPAQLPGARNERAPLSGRADT
ncbi:MAG: hypothetical protein JWR45_45 [Blastococcus sp.]|jgi:hypothetical protein|nr:hypothetical protein [Blastococcus sp.]